LRFSPVSFADRFGQKEEKKEPPPKEKDLSP